MNVVVQNRGQGMERDYNALACTVGTQKTGEDDYTASDSFEQ